MSKDAAKASLLGANSLLIVGWFAYVLGTNVTPDQSRLAGIICLVGCVVVSILIASAGSLTKADFVAWDGMIETPIPDSTVRTAGKAMGGGALGGFLSFGCGIWAGGAMILFGSLLCATGIGALFGLPMILGGLATPFLWGLMGGALGAGVATAPSVPVEPAAPPTKELPGKPADDISAQIRKLSMLRDDGLITEEEFAAKKTQLLERM